MSLNYLFDDLVSLLGRRPVIVLSSRIFCLTYEYVLVVIIVVVERSKIV